MPFVRVWSGQPFVDWRFRDDYDDIVVCRAILAVYFPMVSRISIAWLFDRSKKSVNFFSKKESNKYAHGRIISPQIFMTIEKPYTYARKGKITQKPSRHVPQINLFVKTKTLSYSMNTTFTTYYLLTTRIILWPRTQ